MNILEFLYRKWLESNKLDSTTKYDWDHGAVWLKPAPQLELCQWVPVEGLTHEQVTVIAMQFNMERSAIISKEFITSYLELVFGNPQAPTTDNLNV